MRRGEVLEKVAADKLSLSLEEIVAASGAGADRRTSGRNGRDTPYRNTAGRTHKPGASLQEIAEATSEEERCAGGRVLAPRRTPAGRADCPLPAACSRLGPARWQRHWRCVGSAKG